MQTRFENDRDTTTTRQEPEKDLARMETQRQTSTLRMVFRGYQDSAQYQRTVRSTVHFAGECGNMSRHVVLALKSRGSPNNPGKVRSKQWEINEIVVPPPLDNVPQRQKQTQGTRSHQGGPRHSRQPARSVSNVQSPARIVLTPLACSIACQTMSIVSPTSSSGRNADLKM